jgi:hypothetical protein
VYTTTVGLEMAVRGVRVVVAGQVHYGCKGFTCDPATRSDYFAQLEQLLASQAPVRMTPRQVELARCYADVYFFHYPRPIMWCAPGETDQDMKRCSLEQILRGDCDGGYLDTLDFLAGHHLEKMGRALRRAA